MQSRWTRAPSASSCACWPSAGAAAEALAQYEFLQEVLQSELGAAPSAETTHLYEQIKAGQLQAPTPVVRVVTELKLPAFLGEVEEVERPVFVAREAGTGAAQRLPGRRAKRQRTDGFRHWRPRTGQDGLAARVNSPSDEGTSGPAGRQRELQRLRRGRGPLPALPGDHGHAQRGRRSALGLRSDHSRSRPAPVALPAHNSPGYPGSRTITDRQLRFR